MHSYLSVCFVLWANAWIIRTGARTPKMPNWKFRPIEVKKCHECIFFLLDEMKFNKHAWIESCANLCTRLCYSDWPKLRNKNLLYRMQSFPVLSSIVLPSGSVFASILRPLFPLLKTGQYALHSCIFSSHHRCVFLYFLNIFWTTKKYRSAFLSFDCGFVCSVARKPILTKSHSIQEKKLLNSELYTVGPAKRQSDAAIQIQCVTSQSKIMIDLCWLWPFIDRKEISICQRKKHACIPTIIQCSNWHPAPSQMVKQLTGARKIDVE